MFALRVTYLTGRVWSADYDDGDLKSQPEWPPHPARLLSALVSAWGDSGAEPELRPALLWLEQQDTPTVHAGKISVRKNVQAYVPVNDKVTIPEDRPRKGRTFPSGTVDPPLVYFVWRSEPPSDIANALQVLLSRMSSLGHSTSLVAAEITDDMPSAALNVWQPDEEGTIRMRIPYPGRVLQLERRFQRFQAEPVKMNRPDRGKTALYGVRGTPRQPITRGCFDRMIVLRRNSGPKATLRSTLSITAALRGAVMSGAPQPVPEYLSGHGPESTLENPVPSKKSHVAFAPLAFVGWDFATGELQGLAALLPESLTAEERTVCWDVLSRVKKLEMPWGWWDVELTDAEETSRNLLPAPWTRAANVWSTVTPFVFDRFPKDPYSQEAKDAVALSLSRIGLPEPVDIELHYNAWHTGVPRASLFPAAAARAGKPQRYHSHVRLEFAQPVTGPLAAGAGRFYGYGLFRPHPKEGR